MDLSFSRRACLAALSTATIAGCLEGFRSVTSSEPALSQQATKTGKKSQSTTSTEISIKGPPLANKRNYVPDQFELTTLQENIVWPGTPKDGIPPIDDPVFVSAKSAEDFLNEEDIIFGVKSENTAKVYPQHILVWHEVCNDTIEDKNISITYCPLTGTAMGFYRGKTSFGTTGRLLNSNLVMYDRATNSWWPQMLATAIKGKHSGKSLREFRVIWTTWEQWKKQYPNSQVLSEKTGYVRNYERDPYGSYNPRLGYYAPVPSKNELLYPPLADHNRYNRYNLKRVIIGSRTEDGSIAYLKDSLRKKGLLTGSIKDIPYLAVYDKSLNTGYIYQNTDNSTWKYKEGKIQADDGSQFAPDSLPLNQKLTIDAMWFSWIGFYPDSTIYE